MGDGEQVELVAREGKPCIHLFLGYHTAVELQHCLAGCRQGQYANSPASDCRCIIRGVDCDGHITLVLIDGNAAGNGRGGIDVRDGDVYGPFRKYAAGAVPQDNVEAVARGIGPVMGIYQQTEVVIAEYRVNGNCCPVKGKLAVLGHIGYTEYELLVGVVRVNHLYLVLVDSRIKCK